MHKVRDSLLDLLVFIGLAIVYTIEAIVQYFIPVKYKVKSVVGDIVLITGGGGGLGRLLAERFSKLGATIVVWDINRKGKCSIFLDTCSEIRAQALECHDLINSGFMGRKKHVHSFSHLGGVSS